MIGSIKHIEQWFDFAEMYGELNFIVKESRIYPPWVLPIKQLGMYVKC